jgi:hypothetical protein
VRLIAYEVSWRSCGLKVAKAEVFLDNYRNSPEIARLAIAMSQMPHSKDSAYLAEPREPQRAAGAKPTLASYPPPRQKPLRSPRTPRHSANAPA